MFLEEQFSEEKVVLQKKVIKYKSEYKSALDKAEAIKLVSNITTASDLTAAAISFFVLSIFNFYTETSSRATPFFFRSEPQLYPFYALKNCEFIIPLTIFGCTIANKLMYSIAESYYESKAEELLKKMKEIV